MTLSHPTPFECQMKTSLLSPLSKGWEPFWRNQVHHDLPPLTKIRIASLAELPTAPKAEIKGLLICLPQLVATLDGCKCLLSIAVSDEAIVVTGGEGEAEAGYMATCHGEETAPQGTERDWSHSSHSPNGQPSE